MKNYTTTIPVERTVTEVQMLLGRHGAGRVLVEYQDRQPVGVSFTLPGVGGSDQVFTLPVNPKGMAAAIRAELEAGDVKSNVSRAVLTSAAHAERVAWRVVRDWLDAQLALVAAGQAELVQVMLPYLHVDAERTLYQAYVSSAGTRAALLAAAEGTSS